MRYNQKSDLFQQNAPFSALGMIDSQLAQMISWIFIGENLMSYCFQIYKNMTQQYYHKEEDLIRLKKIKWTLWTIELIYDIGLLVIFILYMI